MTPTKGRKCSRNISLLKLVQVIEMKRNAEDRKHGNTRRPRIISLLLTINKMIASIKDLFLTVRVSSLCSRRQTDRCADRVADTDREVSCPISGAGQVGGDGADRTGQLSTPGSGTVGHMQTNGSCHLCNFGKFHRNAESLNGKLALESLSDFRKHSPEDRAELEVVLEGKLCKLQGRRIQLEIEKSRNSEVVLVILNCLAEVGTEVEVSKLALHFTEVETLNYLLLSLTTRLARTESQLDSVQDRNEKLELRKKQKRLTEQVLEAQTLSKFQERREKLLRTILGKYFDEGFLRLFDTILERKVRYVRDMREVTDRIALMEEQKSILAQLT